MAKKTSTFKIYERLMDEVVNITRKTGPKRIKKLPTEKILGEYFDMVPTMKNSLVFPTMAEEWFWERTSGMVLVPEDEAILKRLYRAKFDITHTQHITFPQKSFVLAIPSGTIIDGVALQSALVSWYPFSKHSGDIFEPFGEWLGIPMGKGSPNLPDGYNPDLPAITLAFKDASGNSAHTKIVAHCEHLPKILNAQSPAEILDVVGMFENTNYEMVIRPDDDELKIQAILLKIVVALGVYYSATKDQGTVEKGMPTAKSRFNRPKQSFVRPFSLKGLIKKEENDTVGEESVTTDRTWHFRQLRHERYYKGQYSDWPIGSRIVFVSEATVTYKRPIRAKKKVLSK